MCVRLCALKSYTVGASLSSVKFPSKMIHGLKFCDVLKFCFLIEEAVFVKFFVRAISVRVFRIV